MIREYEEIIGDEIETNTLSMISGDDILVYVN
jgi:hypothetical protein